MSDLVVSWIRTGVTLLVGWLISWGITSGIINDPSLSQPLTQVLNAVFTGAWYFLVRWLENKWPAFGYLFGIPKAPAYGTQPASSGTQPRAVV